MSLNDSRDDADPSGNYPYPQNGAEATPALHSLILEEIRESGPLSFERYMQHALYHESHGYYTRGKANIGKEGDFFTSVSVGSTFGSILAHRLHAYWLQLGQPDAFHLIELGANNGQLAFDILSEIQHSFPGLYAVLGYHICEHLPAMMEVQAEQLKPFSSLLVQHKQLQDLENAQLTGVILSNELIDAMPVRLIKKTDGQWKECRVATGGEALQFSPAPIQDEALATFAASLPSDLPDGYTTEYRPRLGTFARSLASTLKQGLVITVDYGHTRSSYYAPHRSTGTLRTYYRHQAGEDALAHPGHQDITAHVDFTQLAGAMACAGFGITDFTPQATYLTKHGKEWLQSLEQQPFEQTQKHIRQFQTLTHPSMMGRQFLVLECELPSPSCQRALELTEYNSSHTP